MVESDLAASAGEGPTDCCGLSYAMQSSEYGPSQHLGETADDAEADDNNDNDLANSGTMAEATTVLRWERLVGRLASRLADRKLQLTLFWLQMQLSFTEGCSARRNWLCEKVCAYCGVSAALKFLPRCARLAPPATMCCRVEGHSRQTGNAS